MFYSLAKARIVIESWRQHSGHRKGAGQGLHGFVLGCEVHVLPDRAALGAGDALARKTKPPLVQAVG